MPRPLDWRPVSLLVDQQEEPLLLNVSVPSSPVTPSAIGAHAIPQSYAPATQHESTDVHDYQPSPLALLPTTFSPSNKRPGSSGSASASASPSVSCCRPLPLLVHGLLVWVVLVSLHYLALGFQQSQLRCTVLAASHLLSQTSSPAHWWWDFGTLLGLTREHDIIHTEVDADLSVTWQQRNRIWQQWAADGEAKRTWQQYGFVHLEQREDIKLRLYDSWGWFLDVDVWSEVSSNASLWQFPTTPAPDRTQPDSSVNMQMITGRLEPAQYVLPSAFIYPLVSQPPPSHWLSVCPHVTALLPAVPQMQVPSNAAAVLEHWYGSGWHEPRKFDKGRDRSSDWFEVWMWRKAVRVYELLWAAKVIARVTVNGLRYHTALLAYYATAVTVTAIVFIRACYDWQRRQAAVDHDTTGLSALHSVWQRWPGRNVCSAVSPVTCTVAYVCVLWVVLFTLEYRWYIPLGWGMWRGLLVGLTLPLLVVCLLVSKATRSGSSARAHKHTSSSKETDNV